MAATVPSAERAERRCLLAAALLTALLALITTSEFWRWGVWTVHLARWSADSQQILMSARMATARDWLGWWTGSWIEIGTPYYRPVSSTLMGIEWKLFGEQVIGYCAIGWLIHAVNAVLLFLIGYRIFGGSPGTRILTAFAAAALFTLPTRGNEGAAAADVTWWPAQTDILSLTFTLASLLALDLALARPGRLRLWPALLLGAAALGSKEMAITLPALALLLTTARRRDWRPALLGYLTLTAALLWIRFFAVPNALGPGWKPAHFLGKVLLYLGGEPGHLLSCGVTWPPVAAAASIAAVWGLRRLRIEWPWLVPVPVVVSCLVAGVFGVSWAAPFVAQGPYQLARCALFYLGAWVLLRAPARARQPVGLVACAVVAIHVPIIHVGGVHYYYWPAAFWGLVYAVVLAETARLTRDEIRRALPEWQPATAAGRWVRDRLHRLVSLPQPLPLPEPDLATVS